MALARLEIAEGEELTRVVVRHIKDAAAANSGEPLRILEAGCGRRWPFKLDGVHYELTGVDADADALESRRTQDLDHAILGDLRTVELPAETFDVIYSSFVLEHVLGAQVVLENFVRWLRPGGYLILAFPDRDSVYGFFTRITPFWVHVAYKRYFMGRPNAGRLGHGPYPTHHDKIIGRAAFCRFLADNGFKVLEEKGFGTIPPLQRVFTRTVEGLTFRRLVSGHNNLFYVARHQANNDEIPPGPT